MFFKKDNKSLIFVEDGKMTLFEALMKFGQRKEVSIMKTILLKRINDDLVYLEELIECLGSASYDYDGERRALKRLLSFISSIPDEFYVVQKDSSNVLKMKGLGGSFFELSLSKMIIGGVIYRLKDNNSGRFVEFIEDSDYLDKVEKSCIDGYLILDDTLSKVLEKLRG